MSNVITQPCADKDSKLHYQHTVQHAVALADMLPLLASKDAEALRQIYPNGQCTLWGVVAGPKDRNVSRWQRIQESDVVLFFADNKIFASAVVTYKVQNAVVAALIWGLEKKSEQPFEYLYFLDELKEATIPLAKFKQVVRYEPGLIMRSFEVLREERSNLFLAEFDLKSETYIEPINQTTYENLQNKLNALGETDAEVRSKRRLEQGYLKQHLFDRRTIGACSICQQEYPVSSLVVAHIKRRAECSLEERKDLNVVVPMCKFGCDELFEKGYIAVQAGQVVDLHKQPSTTGIQTQLKQVVGKTYLLATPERAKYFTWHFNDHSK
jgi:hypothetical protein